MLEPYRETSEAALAAIWQLSVRPIRSRSRDDPPAARADPHELLDNALKYTPAGEGLLRGQKLEEGVLKAAEKAREAADPSNDVHASADFRRHLVGVLTERALKQAAARAAQR